MNSNAGSILTDMWPGRVAPEQEHETRARLRTCWFSGNEDIIMTTEENKATIRMVIEELNRGNLLMDAMTPDCVLHNDNPPPPTLTAQEFGLFMEDLLKAMPDYHVVIDDLIAEDEKVVGLYSETATMSGPFMGMEPTGKSYTAPAIEIYRFESGKIAEIWMVRNVASMLQQLGAVPVAQEPPVPAG